MSSGLIFNSPGGIRSRPGAFHAWTFTGLVSQSKSSPDGKTGTSGIFFSI